MKIERQLSYLCHVFHIFWNIVGPWEYVKENGGRWHAQIEYVFYVYVSYAIVIVSLMLL